MLNLKENGNTRSTPTGMAEAINRQFSSVSTEDNTTNLPNLPKSKTDTLPDIHVSENGIRKPVQDLNPNNGEQGK